MNLPKKILLDGGKGAAVCPLSPKKGLLKQTVEKADVLKLKIKITKSGCWDFQKALQSQGYGRTWFKGKGWYVHRLVYIFKKGKIPKGLELDHLCRNRACCNYDHLEAVTPRENMLRGKSVPADNARKTSCKRGHPLSGKNLIIELNGRRQCRICKAMRKRRFILKRKNSQ